MKKHLAKKIEAIAKQDQAMRKNGKWDNKIDRQNTRELKKIINKYGWPDEKLVGKRGSGRAWLIAQHADHDIKFQKRAYKLLNAKIIRGTVSKIHGAYLLDRINVNEGKKQVYGTQFYKTKQGEFKERPIKDRGSLSSRRKSVGLMPFGEYKKKMIIRNNLLNKRK